MVQGLASTFGGGDGYAQIVFDTALPHEVGEVSGSKAGIKWYVLGAGFTRYNAFYFDLTPLLIKTVAFLSQRRKEGISLGRAPYFRQQ